MAKPFAWSYSALTNYETCPKQFYHMRIAKDVKEAPSVHQDWGKRVHSALEYRIRDNTPLRGEMAQFERLASAIMRKEGVKATETKICLNSSFKPTGYFDRDAWVRGVIDVSISRGDSMFMGDWKTGKQKPDSQQLQLSAAMGFSMFPEVKRIVTAFIWMQTEKVDSETFERADAAGIWQSFMPRVQRMEHAYNTTTYPPKPSGLCRRYCAVTSCPHNGQYNGGA